MLPSDDATKAFAEFLVINFAQPVAMAGVQVISAPVISSPGPAEPLCLDAPQYQGRRATYELGLLPQPL
jgi:hypothetical protein